MLEGAQEMEQGRDPQQTNAIAGARGQKPESVSFVITNQAKLEHAGPNLAALRPAAQEGDEIIVLSAAPSDSAATAAAASWYRTITIPDACDFTLRAHIPAVCRKEWIVLLEDHGLINTPAVEAIRELIWRKPDADLIAVLGKNLTSISPWGWANFLHTFALIWAPLDGPPPFAAVTAVIVRRQKLGGEEPLRIGAWELQIIPKIFAGGKVEFSNDIYIDHIKPLKMVSSILIAFHNARAGAALQRQLGIPLRNILYEGWYCFVPRPGLLAGALVRRRHELPPGTFGRLHVIGFGHLIGNIVGSLLGGGRSAHKL